MGTSSKLAMTIIHLHLALFLFLIVKFGFPEIAEKIHDLFFDQDQDKDDEKKKNKTEKKSIAKNDIFTSLKSDLSAFRKQEIDELADLQSMLPKHVKVTSNITNLYQNELVSKQNKLLKKIRMRFNAEKAIIMSELKQFGNPSSWTSENITYLQQTIVSEMIQLKNRIIREVTVEQQFEIELPSVDDTVAIRKQVAIKNRGYDFKKGKSGFNWTYNGHKGVYLSNKDDKKNRKKCRTHYQAINDQDRAIRQKRRVHLRKTGKKDIGIQFFDLSPKRRMISRN